jgi:Protein of unknown function (DUF3611)
MFDFLKSDPPGIELTQLVSSFRWLGWIGFWLQALLGFVPILVVVTTVLFRPVQYQTTRNSLGFWLTIACLAFLIFSIYWCFRYTQLANQLEIRELRPAKSQVIRDLQLGLLANFAMMAIAVLIALSRVGELTFKMLTLPQGSTVITPRITGAGTTIAQGAMITPSNMIAIQAMINAIAAGLVGSIVALLLFYLIGQRRSPQE